MNCCILMGWEIIMQNSLDSFLFKVLIFYKKNIDNSNTEDKSEKEFRKMLSKIIGNDEMTEFFVFPWAHMSRLAKKRTCFP